MKKLRMTHQREIILQELHKCSDHPAADELYERVKKKLPRISLATVYRNLEILSEAGEIKKIEISGRQKRFDWDVKQHNHIYCIHCNRVENIEIVGQKRLSAHPVNNRGYIISGCRIEFLGFCPDCQETMKKQGGNKMGCKKCAPESLNEEQRKVLKALAKSKEACGSKDIAVACGLDSKQVSGDIATLKKKGLVASPARCKYEITAQGKKAIA